MQSGLFKILRDHFSSLDSRSLFCLVQILLGFIQLRTVNLSELSLVTGLRSNQQYSRYRRLQRFFSKVQLDAGLISKLLMKMFKANQVFLCLDRTNWMFGKRHINILVLAVAYKDMAIPIMWSFLNHKGNSNVEQRISLVQRFINLFGTKCIKCLLADREFIGDQWLKWLDNHGIPFVIRVRENMKLGQARGELTTANHLVHGLKPGERLSLSGKRRITGSSNAIKLFVAACRNKEGELVIVITNRDPEEALDHYKIRWEIECLFGCLKTRGFNFESTHITETKKIDTMLSLLAIATAWSYKIGEWKSEMKPIRLKKHLRKSVSIFRYGLDFIRFQLLNPLQNCKENELDLLDDRVWGHSTGGKVS